MWKLLVRPYPLIDSKPRLWLTIFGMGLFIYLFLLVFRPFGLYSLPGENFQMILAGYGLVCSLVLVFDLILLPDIFPRIFNESKWTVGKEIIFLLWNISSVGFGNVLYTVWIWNGSLTPALILRFQFITLLVAFLPVCGLVLIKQLILTRKNLTTAQLLSSSMNHKKRLSVDDSPTIIIEAENPKDNFSLPAYNLLFITSADNYIEIHYMENGVEKTKLVRTTLKSARFNLRQYTAFYRCHRAWIVNLDRVESITGNSQGYKLIVENSAIKIPVSRNLNQELSQRITK
jgi:hypothetical protein